MASGEFHTEGRGRHKALRVPVRVVDGAAAHALDLPCLKLALVTAGSGYARIGSRRVSLVAPAVLCLGPRESAYLDPGLACTAALFLPEFVTGSADVSVLETLPSTAGGTIRHPDGYWAAAFRLGTGGPPRALVVPPLATRRLAENLGRLRHELEGQQCLFWPSWARAFLSEILFLVAQLHHAPETDPTAPGDFPEHPVAPVVLALRRRYREPHTLTALAREFHTNRTTLQQRFRSYTGRSVAAYLRDLRLAMARTLLAEGDLAVEAIAEQVGFADLTGFIRAFRRAYGCTPARYRRSLAPGALR